jgi:hypothetical protein
MCGLSRKKRAIRTRFTPRSGVLCARQRALKGFAYLRFESKLSCFVNHPDLELAKLHVIVSAEAVG